MKITQLLHTFRNPFIRVAVIALISFVVGMLTGVATAHAEWISNMYVEGAGNVGYARTNGWNDNGAFDAWGQSTSSVNLYSVTAWTKMWHPETPPDQYLLESQNNKSWTNSKGGTNATIQGFNYGDFAVTQSTFRVYQQRGTTAYTSSPDGYASCYGQWIGNGHC